MDDMQSGQSDMFIIFSLRDNLYAVEALGVHSILISDDITEMAGSSEHCIGVMKYMAEIIPVVSLRSVFGIKPFSEELEEFMRQRIDDHERWMETLERSAKEGFEFTLATDPHQCAFGKWYDTFKTDNNSLAAHLKKIDTPHKKIHESGLEVKRLVAHGEHEKALEMIHLTRATHFAETTKLLAEAAHAYVDGSREVIIVYECFGEKRGVLVDSIVGVEHVSDVTSLPNVSEEHFFTGAIHSSRSRSEKIIAVMDFQLLFQKVA